MLLAYLLAAQQEQPQQEAIPQGPPTNPYSTQPNRPTPAGISPLGRFNDMVLRQSANIASRMSEGKEAVSQAKQEANDRQRLVDSITHPPPTAPYTIARPDVDITSTQDFSNAPATLQSRYGTGSVSFAPPGTEVHGRFGPDKLPFGPVVGEGGILPPSDNETYQQQMIMDSIAKTLGRKKK